MWSALPEGGGGTSSGHGPIPAGELCKLIHKYQFHRLISDNYLRKVEQETESRADGGIVGGGLEAMGEQRQECMFRLLAQEGRAGKHGGKSTVVDQYLAACSCRMILMGRRGQAGQHNSMLAARVA